MLRRAAHPGEILKDELAENGLSPRQFARDTGLSARTVNQVVNGRQAISPGMAARIGDRLGIDPQFWLNLQAHFNSVHAPGKTPSSSTAKAPNTPPPPIDEAQPF